MSEGGYTWEVCKICGVDRFGMRQGQTLNVKFRERRMTIVGGNVSFECTACGTITTIDLDGAQPEKTLLEDGRTR